MKLLNKVGVDPQKLLGIEVDNASVNTGVSIGVCELLPHLVMIRCVCHSLQLALSYSVGERLPRALDYMISEIYNWFGHSCKRKILYARLYESLNDGETPLQISRVCDTRWISLETAVTRILGQWKELRLHFEIARSSEKCYSAETLYGMYNDPVNKLYCLFLRPIVQDI